MQPSGWLRVHASAPIISHRCSISANVALLYCKAAVGLHIIKKLYIVNGCDRMIVLHKCITITTQEKYRLY